MLLNPLRRLGFAVNKRLVGTFLALLAILALPTLASAQGARYDNLVFTRGGYPASGATIAVCTQPATTTTQPCSPLATLYTDATLTTPCSSVIPLPPNTPGSPCSNPMISDGLGNYHFYAVPGTYTLQFYGPGLTPVVQPDTGVGGGSGGSGVVAGTPPFMAKFIAPNTVSNSTCSDDGTNPTRCPNGMNTATGGYYTEWIADTGGVTANLLVCRSGSSAIRVTTCPVGATTTVVGVAQNSAPNGTVVKVCWAGKCNVLAATPTIQNDFLIPSVSVAGQVDDTGSPVPPTGKTFTVPAENTVAAGNAVQITIFSLDTLANAGAVGSITPCTQFAIADYTAAGTSTTIGCIAPPSVSTSGMVFVPTYKETGSPVAAQNLQPGLPGRIFSGTNDTIACADRQPGVVYYQNTSAANVTVPDVGSGTCWSSSPAFRVVIQGTANVTFNRASASTFTVCSNSPNPCTTGNTSFTLVPGQSALLATADNVNWTVTANTPVSTNFVAAPNVNTISATSYTVLNTDNLWDDKFTATGAVAVTLPKASSITSAPFVAKRFEGIISSCTSCVTSPTFVQAAGNHTYLLVYWGGTNTVTIAGTPTDTAGDTFTRLQPDILGYGFGTPPGENLSVWEIKNDISSSANAVTVNMSSSYTIAVAVVEYTPMTFDHVGTANNANNQNSFVTLPVLSVNEVAIEFAGTSGGNCPSGYVKRANPGSNQPVVCEELLSNTPSVLASAFGGTFNGTAIEVADYSIAGITSFTAGWEFYVENATNPCSAVTVTPQTSVINTAQQTGLTSYVVPCGMTARFRSDGTNYEMFQVTDSSIIAGTVFSNLQACAAAMEGKKNPVTDSTTAVWGATITGGGTNHVLAYCDGSAWTVAAK